MPENPTKREFGIALAIASPPLGATKGSWSPWMISVGTPMRCNSLVRFGWLPIAASCRRSPAGS